MSGNTFQERGAAHPSSRWSQAERDEIAVLLRRGLTAKQIAARFGRSRNAVIGIVARDGVLKAIGFERAPSEKTTDHPRRPVRRSRPVTVRPVGDKAAPVPPKPEPIRRAVPHHVGRPLEMLPACRCKFAVTPHDAPKDAHLFCGEVTEIGKSWCAWHERIVWGRGTAGDTATVKSAERIAA